MDGAEARPVAICMDKGKKLQGICISQVLDFKKMFRRGKDLAGKKSGSELPHSKSQVRYEALMRTYSAVKSQVQ